MFKYNMDYKRRDELIFGDACQPEEKWGGGIKRFSVSPSVLKQLIEERFVDPQDAQNASPMSQKYVEFFDNVANPDDWKVHGYAVAHDREDYRTTIEGCEADCQLSPEDIAAFANLFRFADGFELTATTAYCWFD